MNQPEDTVDDIIAGPIDRADDLDADERRALHEAIDLADEEIERGDGIPAEQVLAEIRALRRA